MSPNSILPKEKNEHSSNKKLAEFKASSHGGLANVKLTIPHCNLWSPEEPYLYELEFRLTSDEDTIDLVKSYFGFREIQIDGNKILLNSKNRFLRLVLDQGFYPDGIYTAPSDKGLKSDIEMYELQNISYEYYNVAILYDSRLNYKSNFFVVKALDRGCDSLTFL